jgi:hypothetical protein
MGALKAAKDHAKLCPGPEAEDLLAEAYAARIADLGKAGMLAEADELLRVASARFPDRSSAWQVSARRVAHARGDLTELLTRWVREPAARDGLAAELRREVRDPAWVADSPVLPVEDPLRQAAVGLRLAFEQAARGQLDEAGVAGLRSVGRRSPLQPWRSFVLALDAFHRHEDARCRGFLEGIADQDGVAGGRDVLRAALLEHPLPEDRAVAQLVTRLVGATPAAAAAAAHLAGIGLGGSAWAAAARGTFAALKQVGRRPVLRLLRGLDAALDCAEAAGIGQAWLGDDLDRLIGLESRNPAETILSFGRWLMPEPSHLRRLDDAALALALEQIATVLDEFVLAFDEVLGEGTFDAWFDGGADPAGLAALQARLTAPQADGAMFVFATLSTLAQLWTAVVARTGLAPEREGASVELLRQIVCLDPTAARFERLAAGCGSLDGRLAAQTRWAEVFPEDPRPWLQRAEDAEEVEDFDAAERYLRAAEAAAPLDASVRAAGLRLRVASLRTRWWAGERDVCRQVLGLLRELPAARRPEVRAFVLAAAARIDAEARVGTAPPAELVDVAGSVPRAAAMCSLVDHVLAGEPVRTFGSTVAERLAVTAFVAGAAAEVGFHLEDLPLGLEEPADLSAADLPSDPAMLFGLCALGSGRMSSQLRRLAAGQGLLADGPWLARFLAHYAQSLPRNASRRLRRCAQLVRFHAARLGDRDILRSLDDRGRYGREIVDEAEATRMLAELRAEVVAEQARPKPRRKTRSRRAGQLDLPFGSGGQAGEGADR